jgi:hypothetical protein
MRSFADDYERGPVGRMGVAAASPDQRQHGEAQGLGHGGDVENNHLRAAEEILEPLGLAAPWHEKPHLAAPRALISIPTGAFSR